MIIEVCNTVAEWLSEINPQMKKIIWGRDIDDMNAFTKYKHYPFCIFNHELSEDEMAKSYDVPENNKVTKYFVLPTDFQVNFYVEKQREALNLKNQVRFFIEKNQYLEFTYEGNPIRLGIRILYIKLDEGRGSSDPQGSQKGVVLKFKVSVPVKEELVESVYDIQGVRFNYKGFSATFVKGANGWNKI